MLALPLVPLGIYGVYPHPIYDSDCILSCLLSLFLLTSVFDDGDRSGASAGTLRCLMTGAACALPVFAKQNIGILFFGAVIAATAAIAMRRSVAGQTARRELLVIGGAAAGLASALVVLRAAVGLGNYLRWTVQFAAQRRLPGMGLILSAYPEGLLVWSLPCAIGGVVLLSMPRARTRHWASVGGVMLMTAPFIWTLVQLVLQTDAEDRADQLLALWPLGSCAWRDRRGGPIGARADLANPVFGGTRLPLRVREVK